MKVERKTILRMVMGGFALFLLIYWFWFTGQRLISAATPIFIGVLIAYPLGILIRFFQSHDILYNRKILKSEKLHRGICTALAVIVLLGCLAFIAGYMGPQLTACAITLLDRVPSGIRYLLEMPFIANLIPDETLEVLQEFDWTNWFNRLVTMFNSDDLFRGVTNTATSLLNAFSNVMFGILFACYFLSGRDQIGRTYRRMVRAWIPAGKQERVLRAGRLLNSCFHKFIVCQVLQAVIIGVSATLLMHLFRFPYASMVGAMNGFCALIPVIGGYIGAILGTLMILTDAPSMALLFLIFIVVLQNVVGTLIFPRIAGQSLGLPSGWTLAAVLIGSGLGGITGILIGVPLTAFGYRMVKDALAEKEASLRLAEGGEPEAKAAAGNKQEMPGAPGKNPEPPKKS